MRSEIKEEPKAGDIRGARYPVGVIAALNNSAKNNSAASPSPSKNEAKC